MKLLTTKKAVRENFTTIIKIPYCGLQNLLRTRKPFAYAARNEGWACDFYDMGNGVCISTGYDPIGNVSPPYSMVKDYDSRAATCEDDYKYLDKIIKGFVDACGVIS